MDACWIGVACATHVRRGVAGGFLQLCHGKAAPLARLRPGDRIAFYAPAETFRGRDRLRAFVGLGTLREGAPYQVELAPSFRPFRRDVAWEAAAETPIAPLLPRMRWSREGNWGAKLRFGLLSIAAEDMAVIVTAMRFSAPEPSC